MSGYTDFEWMDQAACTDTDPKAFFPETTGRNNTAGGELICQSCPVSQPCGAFQKKTHSAFGVWGGKTIRSKSAGPGAGGPYRARTTRITERPQA